MVKIHKDLAALLHPTKYRQVTCFSKNAFSCTIQQSSDDWRTNVSDRHWTDVNSLYLVVWLDATIYRSPGGGCITNSTDSQMHGQGCTLHTSV